MLNNCYTLRHSPVFRNPKSNVAVQQLTTLINETASRSPPLQPQVKKIIGIKKNSLIDHQLPLCDVPFQTNFFAQNENDLSYSNRSNIQTNRQFSRNQRTQSVYTGNKENFVRSPTRSPFSKPIIQKDCYTPIYKRSPIQRVQSPGIIGGIRQTNQRGFGSISPLRIQQKPNQREPLSEMVDNLKQNIMRDIQEVTRKYSNTIVQVNLQPERFKQEQREVRYDDIKAQELKKQKYLEQQALLLQQQLELIKSQQSKLVVLNKQTLCSQDNPINATSDPNKLYQQRQNDLSFLRSLENQNRSQSFADQQSNFQSLRCDQTQKIKQIQEIKNCTCDPQYQVQGVQQQYCEEWMPIQNTSKYNYQIDYLQKLNYKIESIQKHQNQQSVNSNNQEFKTLDEFCRTTRHQEQKLINSPDLNQEKQALNQYQSRPNFNQENQYPEFQTGRNGYSPIRNKEQITANKETTLYMLNNNKQMLSTLNSQNELQKLKNLQLELMQNKPLFEQPKPSKIEFNFNQQKEIFDLKIDKNYLNTFQQLSTMQQERSTKEENIEEKTYKNLNFNKNKTAANKNVQQQQLSKFIQLQNQQEQLQEIGKQLQQQQKLPAYLKEADDTDDDVNNQITISNLSSIIPAEISANQNKKINVSFESSIEQQQFEYLKGSDCRNTFGPLQLEIILKSPKSHHEIIPQYLSPCQLGDDVNNQRQQVQNLQNDQDISSYDKQDNVISRQLTNNHKSEKKQSALNYDEGTQLCNKIEQIETVEKRVNSQSRDQKELENQSREYKVQNSSSTYKTKSSQSISNAKYQQAYSPIGIKNSIVVQPFFKESPSNRIATKESEKNKNQIKSQQSVLENKNYDKICSGQSQRYSDYKDESNQVEKEKQEQDVSLNNSSRYEQMLQNFQSMKNQSRIDYQQENQTIKVSMQMNECEHISDFVIFSDKQNENQLEIVKKKTVTFNDQLIQQSPIDKDKVQGGTNFSDFMKTKALDILSSDSIPIIPQDTFTLAQLQPKGGISFLQYKQQLEN
ncbi:unnamed protein product (macronuclear) [Paramecium tetraurelia]|uniref:Endo-1,4-beta-xylanase xylA n=1 Tax=Paramecium tetraurelia TaxID=5888 RepID=A0CSY9_PARTE|nr:uncharacterized protein GSPATT00010179001 [Paramecium tetraurelia]CAK73906.1 unnamed protein product [Paramecium tetraurelia]|eukprot:XP_001441303.1 hypothetical protein (macronuclear) [Paramecium tetraurelia strain d4-2]